MDIAIAVREKAKAAASRKQCMSDGSVSIKQLVKAYVDDRGRPTRLQIGIETARV